jgi:hypothetical protein
LHVNSAPARQPALARLQVSPAEYIAESARTSRRSLEIEPRSAIISTDFQTAS